MDESELNADRMKGERQSKGKWMLPGLPLFAVGVIVAAVFDCGGSNDDGREWFLLRGLRKKYDSYFHTSGCCTPSIPRRPQYKQVHRKLEEDCYNCECGPEFPRHKSLSKHSRDPNLTNFRRLQNQ